jgi:hypothetical protein
MTIDVHLAVLRPFEAADAEAARALIGDIRPLRAAGGHAVVSTKDGVLDGVALWFEPPAGSEEAYLGPVIAPGVSPGLRFYEMVLMCARDAAGLGYLQGFFTVKDRGLLRMLTQAFRISPVATGWETEGGMPREWEVHVDLTDAIEQLREMISVLGGTDI